MLKAAMRLRPLWQLSRPRFPEHPRTCADVARFRPLLHVAGGIEQVKLAHLMNEVCKERKCQFVVNTADNFYTHGCHASSDKTVAPHDYCSQRWAAKLRFWQHAEHAASRGVS